MLEQHVIEPAHGPWASPIILVQKKDGSTRFCVDFRSLNSVTQKDAHPLPRIDDTLDALGGAQWFFWSVPVSGNALWPLQCPKHFSMNNGASTAWTSMGNLSCLSG